MADVSLITTPDSFALTKGGRMRYAFEGAGRYQTTGVLATGVLFSVSPITPGTKLTLRWNGSDHTLLFVAAPSAVNEFTAGDGSRAYMLSLLAELKSYFPIREDFLLTPYDPTQLPGIVFTARKPGPAYDIAFSNPVGTPFTFGNSIFGADPILRAQYSIYCELWCQKPETSGDNLDTDYERIFAPNLECDETGKAEFDAGNVLHAYLSADLPDFTTSAAQPAQYSTRKYFICYGEAWGQPIRPGKIHTDIVRQAYLGGADFAHRSGAGFNLIDFIASGLPTQDKALRFGPTVRPVRIDEPQFLTFINVRSDNQVTLQVGLTFSDESTAVMTGPPAVVTFQPGTKLCFNVGVATLGLLAQVPAGKFLKEYQVSLRGQRGDCSRAYRYIVDYDLPEYRRYFTYLNSLGGFSSLMTYGKGSAELQRFYDQAETYLPVGYDPKQAQYTDFNVSRQQQFEVASGWQSQQELASWDDFYGSPIRLLSVGTNLYAIGLTNKSIKQAKDGDHQFAHALTLVYLHRDEFYTDTDTLDGDETLPRISMPAGTVVVQSLQPVLTRDPSVPDVVRSLTPADIQGFKTAAARPNPATLGLLDQTAGSLLFRRKDQLVSFANDLTDKPTTRNQAGILDVPTVGELFTLIHVTPRLSSWIGDIIPDET